MIVRRVGMGSGRRGGAFIIGNAAKFPQDVG
jgi:hypothetical protein